MRRLLVGALLAGVAALSAPASAGAAEYSFDVGCGLSASTPPSHVCEIDDQIGAFFEVDEDTEYEVCVEFPSATFICAEEQFAQANVLYVNEITTNELGQHFVTWWVGEELVGFWDFEVIEPPKPPTPAPSPAPAPTPSPAPAPSPAPTPTVTPTAPPLSAACVKARRSLARSTAQLRNAQRQNATPKRKARLRGQVRKAKAAVRRFC
jgi:hypothetical protein